MQNLILDLDNTIYPVKSIGEKLFAPLFNLLQSPEFGLEFTTITDAKEQIMRIPFQKVAPEFDFPATLTNSAMELLRNLSYDEPMSYFEDYRLIREIGTRKFLLTTGFKKLQESKVRSLQIENDFAEIFIVDLDTSALTKKDVMIHIMEKYNLLPEGLLVVGDDPESEIKAGNELNIKTFLLDAEDVHPQTLATYKGKTLGDVLKYLAG